MEEEVPAVRVLVFPYPAQGHMIPLLDLAEELSTCRGLHITILLTPGNLPLLQPLLSRSPAIQTLVLPFPSHPSIPPGVENNKDLRPPYFKLMLAALGGLRDPLLQWAKSTAIPPDAIISDFFLGWTNEVASELGIPRLVFCSSGALALSCNHFLWRELPKRPDPSDPAHPVTFSKVPNSPTYPWYQISSLYRSYREGGDPVSEFIRGVFLTNIRSHGYVFNTFEGLEQVYLDHLREDLGHSRVWAIGPIGASRLSALQDASRGGASSVPVDRLLGWLDSCADGSVVYVCFGSQMTPSPPQAKAIAAALEGSGAKFVWAMKAEGLVPEGFEARTAGRGLVVRGWAPQVAILSHRAVGSFLSHCGWNSVLEGVWTGKVFLTWPCGADQYWNARLLVEDAGVGIRACEAADSVPDPGELAGVIAESVRGDRPEIKRALALREMASTSTGKGGASSTALENLVADLISLKSKNRCHKI